MLLPEQFLVVVLLLLEAVQELLVLGALVLLQGVQLLGCCMTFCTVKIRSLNRFKIQ
mgnify:CR=1 FL=1